MGGSFSRRLRMLSPIVEDGVAELRAAWRSHALTLMGLVWGSAAVVLLLSFGVGFTQFLDLGVRKTGDRWTVVQSEYTTAESGGAPGSARPAHRRRFRPDPRGGSECASLRRRDPRGRQRRDAPPHPRHHRLRRKPGDP